MSATLERERSGELTHSYLIPLGDLRAKDSIWVGTKAANLGELTSAGFPVPRGFVIPADKNPFNDNGKVDPQFIEELRQAFASLGSQTVFVRSSASVEDSPSFSWAGQFKTIPNVTLEDLVASIEEVTRSGKDVDVGEYARRAHLESTGIQLSVIIQETINSEYSGTAFSRHPVLRNSQGIYIESAKGQGENVVSGLVTPDQFLISREDGKIDKLGEEHILNSRNMDNTSGIPSEALREIGFWLMKAEELFGVPVDMEWAYQDGKVYILQCRPITTIRDDRMETSTQVEIPNGPDWFLYITRPFRLLDSSLLAYALQSEKTTSLLGEDVFNDFLTIEQRVNFARHFRDKDQHARFEQLIGNLLETNPKFVREILQRGIDLNLQAIEFLKDNVKVETLEHALELFVESRMFSGILPRIIAEQISQMGLNHSSSEMQEMLKICEMLRSTSYYRRVTDEIVIPLIQQRFAGNGINLSKDDVLLLTISEVLNIDKSHLIERHEARSSGKLYVHTVNGKLETVQWTGSTTDLVFGLEKLFDRGALAESGEISGETASPGKAIGIARVITDPGEEHEFEDGDILITINGNPVLRSYMERASAIVADEGGISSHASIVARELGIPCITATVFGTELIPDGSIIEIEADPETGKGTVRIIKRGQSRR